MDKLFQSSSHPPSNHPKQNHEEEKRPGRPTVKVSLRRGRSSGSALMEMPTDPCRIPSLPSSPGEREGSGPEVQGCRGRAGAGHPSHGPSFPGFPHAPPRLAPVPPTTPPRKAVSRARLGNVFPKGRAGAESQRITLEENCQLPADVRVGQGSRVYLLTSLLPLPALIALWGMDIISSCPHLGRMKEEWRVDPRWLGDPGRRRECTRMGQTS